MKKNESRYLREYIITDIKGTYYCMADEKGKQAFILISEYNRLLEAESTEHVVPKHVERESKVFKGVKY
jgi:hypothetical protein